MPSIPYFGTYARFNTSSKKDGAALMGPDNLVGDIYNIEFRVENGRTTAWMINRFGAHIGFFDAKTSRQLSLCKAQDMTLKALLAFVAYDEAPDPGVYWGEVALVCYPASEAEIFEVYIETLSKRMAQGIRPEIDLNEQGYQHVVDSNGSWTPKETVPLPKMKSGSAFVKTRRSLSESLIEQGRKGNKGCYFVSCLFLVAVVVLIVFTFRACGVF